MRKPSWMLVFVTVLALLTLRAAPAAAKESEAQRKQRARAFIEEGQGKYDLGKYDEAIRLFEQAYEIWPYPEVLYNLCQSHRQKRDFERAVFYCKAYLRNDPDTARRAEVEKRIADMEQQITSTTQTAEEPPKDVVVPEGPSATEPPATPAPIPSPREPASPWYSDPVGWSLVGGGVVLLGAGAGLQVSALSLRDDGDAAPTPEEQDRLYDRAESRQTWAWVALGAGAVATTVGIVKLWTHDDGGAAPAVSAAPLEGGAALVWRGTF
jgi:tetratricopeptide (TPR) repeat protein